MAVLFCFLFVSSVIFSVSASTCIVSDLAHFVRCKGFTQMEIQGDAIFRGAKSKFNAVFEKMEKITFNGYFKISLTNTEELSFPNLKEFIGGRMLSITSEHTEVINFPVLEHFCKATIRYNKDLRAIKFGKPFKTADALDSLFLLGNRQLTDFDLKVEFPERKARDVKLQDCPMLTKESIRNIFKMTSTVNVVYGPYAREEQKGFGNEEDLYQFLNPTIITNATSTTTAMTTTGATDGGEMTSGSTEGTTETLMTESIGTSTDESTERTKTTTTTTGDISHTTTTIDSVSKEGISISVSLLAILLNIFI